MRRSALYLIFWTTLSACATLRSEPTATPLPPTQTPLPASCASVEGVCVELFFDGDECNFEGPSTLNSGPLTFIFHNESDDWASSNFMKLDEGKSVEDLNAYFWEEPSENHQPPWAISMPKSWKEIQGGEMHFWEGNLDAGIYTIVCVHTTQWPEPIGVWVGPIWNIES